VYNWILVRISDGKYNSWSVSSSQPYNAEPDVLIWVDYRINTGTDDDPVYEGQDLPFDQYDGETYYWDFDNEYFIDSDGNEVVSEEETE